MSISIMASGSFDSNTFLGIACDDQCDMRKSFCSVDFKLFFNVNHAEKVSYQHSALQIQYLCLSWLSCSFKVNSYHYWMFCAAASELVSKGTSIIHSKIRVMLFKFEIRLNFKAILYTNALGLVAGKKINIKSLKNVEEGSCTEI